MSNSNRSFSKTQNELSVYLSRVFHSGAYLINRNAARRLVSKALPIKLPLDKYFTRSWEFDLKFTGVEPVIVHQTYGGSYIGRDSVYIYSKIEYPEVTLVYVMHLFQTSIMIFFYNFKIFLQQVL